MVFGLGVDRFGLSCCRQSHVKLLELGRSIRRGSNLSVSTSYKRGPAARSSHAAAREHARMAEHAMDMPIHASVLNMSILPQYIYICINIYQYKKLQKKL